MKPLDLISAATHLLDEQRPGPPRQAFLKRAISTAYYAMFHCLCATGADCLVGASRRNAKAWLQIYRAFDHGTIKRQCRNQGTISQSPESTRNFGEKILELQEARHQADYNPASRYTLRQARNYVNAARKAINKLSNASKQDRTNFAVGNLLRHRL